MKKVYLSGKWSQRSEFQHHAKMLWQHGYEVVSTWVNESGDDAWQFGTWRDARLAMRDLNQIAMADLFIIDTLAALSQDGGGGRETELGFALANYQHSEIWRVGPIKNPFHSLASRTFLDWTEVYDCLK
jgi:hypothetical protein